MVFSTRHDGTLPSLLREKDVPCWKQMYSVPSHPLCTPTLPRLLSVNAYELSKGFIVAMLCTQGNPKGLELVLQ